MRKRSGSPPSITPKQNDNIITQEREYEIITPLFGGGVNPGEADPITMVRGTEIRGQLRFWWRATRGGRPEFDGNLAKMKKAEDELWGAAYNKDEDPLSQEQKVQIIVERFNLGTRIEPYKVGTDNRGNKRPIHIRGTGIPDYAAFPLQPSQDGLSQPNIPLKAVQKGVSFTLIISFPKTQQMEVEAALWAWETFGGIGARTRRGFGALHLLKINGANYSELPLSNKVNDWVNEKLTKYVTDEIYPEEIAHISRGLQYNVTPSFNNAMEAWNRLINKLSGFRQIPDGRSGRSNWPEPEAIRALTHRRYFKYEARPNDRKFPRAVFGLPIIFHFKDSGDPEEPTLQGENDEKNKIERLASPLLLRPLLCKDGRAVGLALLLEGPRIPPGGLRLIEKGSNKQHIVDAMLTQNEADTIPVLRGETDVLQAFLKYL
jgi:CRISPR-associated protein Cmr1